MSAMRMRPGWAVPVAQAVVPPLVAWVIVSSGAPQFREYAVEGTLLWVCGVIVRHLARAVTAFVAGGSPDTSAAGSSFDAFVRQIGRAHV